MTEPNTSGPIKLRDAINKMFNCNLGLQGYQITQAAAAGIWNDLFPSDDYRPKPDPRGGHVHIRTFQGPQSGGYKRADVSTKPTESIIAAAVQWEGVTFSLPKPARHGQVLHSLESGQIIDRKLIPYVCQGFLTSEGRFVNRVQARHIAYRAGQNPKTTGSDRDLYSEDLW